MERQRKSEVDLDRMRKDQKAEKAKIRGKNKRVYLGRFVGNSDPATSWSEEAKKA